MKEINKCKCLFFSPTGTTKAIVGSIADSIGLDTENIDVTKLAARKKEGISFSANDLVVVGLPVYSGRIPVLVEDFMKGLTGNGAFAVVVVVYGNRAYDDALLELKNISTQVGFKTLAAAAFIGEHSMSSNKYPIAVGRPDERDFSIAKSFGSSIKQEIEKNSVDLLGDLLLPGATNYKERKPKPEVSPETNNDLCVLCGKCVDNCPTSAIKQENSVLKTDSLKCITCYACIKSCTQNARKMTHELFVAITERLFNNCQERKEPEVFKAF